jgi:hypothetical protein
MFENKHNSGAGNDHDSQPVRGDWGASIMGPRNAALEAENPDLLASPYTDAGTIPNLKFSFAAARNRLAKAVGRAKSPCASCLLQQLWLPSTCGLRRAASGKCTGNAFRKRQDYGRRRAGPQLYR